jgi:hypothetical protein
MDNTTATTTMTTPTDRRVGTSPIWLAGGGVGQPILRIANGKKSGAVLSRSFHLKINIQYS